ncbi:MAG TPA: hypothetical protein VFH36_17220 [Acidimicrobiales bacterium]|nr:hypothetical protein [Acidimicrobiales bacterium]
MTPTIPRTAAPPWAALASIAAGAVHATAAGAHGEHRQTVLAFGLLAVAQVAWGALALVRAHPAVSWLGVAVNATAVAGWVLAKTTGIGPVDGLEAAEGLGFADTLAAALAVVAAGGALAALAAPGWRPRVPGAGQAAAAAAVTVLVTAAMVSTGGHSHGGGHGHEGDPIAHDHDDEDDGHAHGEGESASGGHEHGIGTGGTGHQHDGAREHGPGDHDDDDHAPGDHDDDGHRPGDHDDDDPGDHDPGDHRPGLPTKPYDGTLPVDLSGVPGVTPEQQASAEALVTDTIIELPRYADPADAVAAGYRSVGDAFTGHEHFINWPLMSDGRVLDAEHPESLVYRVDPGGRRTLVAAMYMLEPGSTLDTVPDIGGPLVQWHVHRDLCWSGQENAWQVTSVVSPSLPCPAGSSRRAEVPMVHVWTVAHPCGPFAALEGISGGQVGEGEEVLCDHAHGSPA